MLRDFKAIAAGIGTVFGAAIGLSMIMPLFFIGMIKGGKSDVLVTSLLPQLYTLGMLFVSGAFGVHIGSITAGKAKWLNSIIITSATLLLVWIGNTPRSLSYEYPEWYILTSYFLTVASLPAGHAFYALYSNGKLRKKDPAEITDGTQSKSYNISFTGVLLGFLVSLLLSSALALLLVINVFFSYKSQAFTMLMQNPVMIALTMLIGLISVTVGGYVTMTVRKKSYFSTMLYGGLSLVLNILSLFILDFNYAEDYQWMLIASLVLTLPCAYLGAYSYLHFKGNGSLYSQPKAAE